MKFISKQYHKLPAREINSVIYIYKFNINGCVCDEAKMKMFRVTSAYQKAKIQIIFSFHPSYKSISLLSLFDCCSAVHIIIVILIIFYMFFT